MYRILLVDGESLHWRDCLEGPWNTADAAIDFAMQKLACLGWLSTTIANRSPLATAFVCTARNTLGEPRE